MTFALLLLTAVLISTHAYANPACAVCTVAVGASLEIARQLGVDDSVVGVWSGAFLTLVGYWAIKYFDKKNWHFAGRDALLMVVSLGTVGFLYLGEMSYQPKVLLCVLYLDPFLFSFLAGALVFAYTSKLYQWMKARNGGHAHFPFEKVVLPVVALLALSTYFYYNPICVPAADNLLAGF